MLIRCGVSRLAPRPLMGREVRGSDLADETLQSIVGRIAHSPVQLPKGDSTELRPEWCWVKMPGQSAITLCRPF